MVFDFAEPASCGLDRFGCISRCFPKIEEPDFDLMKRWIAESYQAVAPKKLASTIPGD